MSLSAEVALLFAQLEHPAVALEWWAAQALARLLTNDAYCDLVAARLFESLRHASSEIETAELLFVAALARDSQAISVKHLACHISRPSLLSELVLASLDSSHSMDLSGCGRTLAAPDAFVPSPDFERWHGQLIPRIFRTRMERLEEATGLSFIRQYAFEWEQLEHVDHGRVQDIRFWLSNISEDTGFFNIARSRRYRSAFLRTIDFAYRNWQMPLDRAADEATLGSPAEPTFLYMKPCRPAWLPQQIQEADVNAAGFEKQVRTVLNDCLALEGRELAWLKTRMALKEGGTCDLSIAIVVANDKPNESAMSRLAQDVFSTMACVSVRRDLYPTSAVLPLEQYVWSRTPLIVPIARRFFPGCGHYWQNDLTATGLGCLMPTDDRERFELAPKDGIVQMRLGGSEVGTLSYWYSNWGPSHPRDGGPGCGVALRVRPAVLQERVRMVGGRRTVLWRLEVLPGWDGGKHRDKRTLAGMFQFD